MHSGAGSRKKSLGLRISILWKPAPQPPSQGNCIKIAVILRWSDARWAKVAGIAQPKNPVRTR